MKGVSKMYVGERRLDAREGEKMRIDDHRTGRSTVFVSALIVTLALLAPSAASAWPDSPFTPELTFNSTTYEAGAHPDLTFEMHKGTRTGCNPPGFGTDGIDPGYYGPFCNIDAEEGEEDFYYIDQDLKKMGASLPPGLMGDVNAAPYCEATQSWVKSLAFPDDGFLYEKWRCADQSVFPDALVGYVYIVNYLCREKEWTEHRPFDVGCPLNTSPAIGAGAVYNERPRRDANGRLLEQGHLVVIWGDERGYLAMYPPGDPMHETVLQLVRDGLESNNASAGMIKTDISIRMRDGAGDFGIDSIADDIPDLVNPGVLDIDTGEITRLPQAGQISDMEMGLGGSWVGADKGHPFLSNPTFCEPQTIGVEFQGYTHNSTNGWVFQPDTWPDLGYGDGKIVTPAPIPYQATNCDAVPFAPTFTAGADSEAPGAAAALSTVITQKDDEASTKKVHVEFPKGMGVNINSTLTPCSAADLAAKSCPEVSKMGTVSAESRLLPKRAILGDSVKPEDEVLTGSVYLTGQDGDKLTLSALLSGFIDLRLDAKAAVRADGTLTATFDDIPSTTVGKFTLNLFGGNRSLLTNPKACGTHTTRATFTSHSGKIHTVETTTQVKGCPPPPAPEFEVDISNNGKGKRTTLELDLSVRERYIKRVTFGLPRYMKWSTRRMGKKKRFGSARMETERGELESSLSFGKSLRAKRKKKKTIRFQTKGALNKLKISLFKKTVVKVRTKSGKKRTLKKTVHKSRMAIKSLPKQDIKGLTVELNPSESRFLRNPKGCKNPLKFLAFVTTSDGKRHVLSQKVKLKGKGCSKKKKSKKKSKKSK